MRKNAFTLIELLAVIVILGIIALIAVPIVINIINDVKTETLRKSIYLYIDAVDKNISSQQITDSDYEPDECIIQENGNLICTQNGEILKVTETSNELEISVEGKKPSSGALKLLDGTVVDIVNLFLDEKYYNYDSNNNIVALSSIKAGLYGENNYLLATWDELVTKYKLDITKDHTSSTKYMEKDSGSMYDVLTNNEKLSNAKLLIIEEKEENNKIGNYAFANCINLTNVKIPSSVKTIGEEAFFKSGITSIEIPNRVTSIEIGAFELCTDLISVIFEKNSQLKTIRNGAFYNCRGLTSIEIPNRVTSIGNSAFHGCSSLTNVVIPNRVTSIGNSTFEFCSSLTNVVIQNSVTSIGAYAFAYSGLTSITIPSSVTSIGESVFKSCRSLTSIIFEQNSQLTSIGSETFYDCRVLTSITIPSKVTSIGKIAFYGCSSLTSVTFKNTARWFTADSASATTGDSINVTNPETNATNLRNSYVNKYLKRK